MRKDEWLDYFEAVNGRKPNPKEFKEALDRGDFILSPEGADPELPSTKTGEPQTATEKALAQAEKERLSAQEALANTAQEKRQALSQTGIASAKTLQSGRQAEVLWDEERQRQQVEETKARLASYARPRPDTGARGKQGSEHSQSKFSGQTNQVPLPTKEEARAAKQAARDKAKSEKQAAKQKAKEEKQAAKLEKRLMRQLKLLEKIQGAQDSSSKKHNRTRGALISSLVAIALMIGIGGGYGFWRNASGDIEGTWELKSSQVMDKKSGKLTNGLKEYQEKGEIFSSYLEVNTKNQLQTHSYSYPKTAKDKPIFTASDYLKSYQEVDQWNKSITYTMDEAQFKKDLTKIVGDLYPNAEKSLVDYYITDNVDNYKFYRKGKRTKSYTVDKNELIISTYNEDGKLTSRDTYQKANARKAKQLKTDYSNAKATYDKNRKQENGK